METGLQRYQTIADDVKAF